MFAWLGRFVVRRRHATLIVAGLFLAASIVSLVRSGPLTSGNIAGLEAGDAEKEIERITGRDVETTFIVHFRSATLASTDPAFAEEMERALAPVRADPRVLSVMTPDDAPPPIAPRMVAAKKRAAFALVSMRGGFKEARRDYESVRTKLRSDTLSIACTGKVPYMHDLDATLEHDLMLAELVSMPLALLVLILVFRTAVAAALPVGVGALAVVGAIGVVLAISHVTDIAQYTINICSLIGLGVAIDYSLFTVSRYREELAAGRAMPDAIERTMQHAGKVVAFSGAAVATGLAGLFFFRGSFLFAMGVGASIVVALAVIFALTFLPALLAVLGDKIHAGKLPIPETKLAEGAWRRAAEWVMKRPLLVLVPTLAFLLALGAPFLRLRLAAADVRVVPTGIEARDGHDRLREDFPDEAAPHAEIVVRFPSSPALDEARIRALHDLSRRVGRLSGVVKVESIVDKDRTLDEPDEPEDAESAKEDLVATLLHPNELAAPMVEMGKKLTVGDRTVYLRATLEGPPDGPAARDAVREIRAQRAVADGALVVGGQTATDLDTTKFVIDRAPRAIAFVVGVTFIVLLVLLESLLLPLKALLMNAVSLAGSFGAIVWLFQDGHWFVREGRPLEPALPVLLFCVLFGLSMDYEVLMLSRMKEAWERTHDNTRAVAEGLEKTAGLITSAAAIMVAVFAAFALARVVIVQAVGVGMALAVALDATLVRVLLVPSTMRLLGPLNWWAPRWLRRIKADEPRPR
ncbi:MAG: MMPL family transporter [Labilithrix sp.]|nr:MMPL family transporter [Labilithrix sp.]